MGCATVYWCHKGAVHRKTIANCKKVGRVQTRDLWVSQPVDVAGVDALCRRLLTEGREIMDWMRREEICHGVKYPCFVETFGAPMNSNSLDSSISF